MQKERFSAEFPYTFRQNHSEPQEGVSASVENLEAYFAEDEAAEPAPVQRAWYDEPQLKRSEHYHGPLKERDEAEVRRMLTEVLRYFNLSGFDGIPFPPEGLPGTRYNDLSYDDPALALIAIGWRYFLSSAGAKSRAMHHDWDDAVSFIRRIQMSTREEIEKEQMEAELERRTELDARRDEAAASQLAYFIAAESGPIKIGIAANPQQRCRDLQTSHHAKLSVLATCAGGREQERAYHEQFAAYRLHGEWFERHPDILTEIERLRA